MRLRLNIVFILVVLSTTLKAQEVSSNIQEISIEANNNFDGYDLIDTNNKQLFVIAEHWHNIRSVPKATIKLLKYLHANAGVRILAIEQGASAAHMVNSYLDTGDTTTLRQIARNTLFWGQENWAFFEELRTYNQSLPDEEQIFVKSIDIEYKMASAIFVINEYIGNREIPESLSQTVGIFKEMFDQTKEHRESFQGLSVMYYYDRNAVESLVLRTIDELEIKSEEYMSFFGDNFVDFATMILDMDDGLTFDYTNPNKKYRFRDDLIYDKFVSLVEEYPETGILCVIGMRHATKGSSIYKLNDLESSPLKDRVVTIKTSALFNRLIISSDLKKFNYNYPRQLKTNAATLIKHDPQEGSLKSSKSFDYTLFINDNGKLTPFDKVYKEEY